MYLALDIGGTKTTAALFSDDGILQEDSLCTAPTKTFDGEEAVYQTVLETVQKSIKAGGMEAAVSKQAHRAAHKIDKDVDFVCGVGCPGPLDRERGLIIHAPLMGWKNFPLAKRLYADSGLPVCIDKDGNLAALAEVKCGVAQGLQNIVYVTVSTGIGAGLVINGEVYRGTGGGAGEIGHISLDPDGPPCPCGSRGCFELYASGTALIRQMEADRRAGIKSLAFELAPEGAISGRHLDEAAAAGDNYALELYRREGFYLGAGLANVFNLLAPQAVVLGGGVTKGRAFFHKTLMETLRERCIHPLGDGAVRYSEMNDRVVLYGAYFMMSGQEFRTED